MALDGTAVKELRAGFALPMVLDQKPGQFGAIPQGWTVSTKDHPKVVGLGISTLTGLSDYVKAAVDALPAKIQFHVKSGREVVLLGPLEGEAQSFRRQTFLYAAAREASFPFGQMIDHERFVIALQTCFVPTPARDELLVLVSKISESEVRESNDDGIGQQVTVQRGVSTVGKVKLPNPILLAPYRTFLEIDQPESLFVLRARGGGEMPTLGLFEADGGSWGLEAIKSIALWIRADENLKNVPVIA